MIPWIQRDREWGLIHTLWRIFLGCHQTIARDVKQEDETEAVSNDQHDVILVSLRGVGDGHGADHGSFSRGLWRILQF